MFQEPALAKIATSDFEFNLTFGLHLATSKA